MLEYRESIKSESLERLQQVQLGILELFYEHCKVHNLTYFLVAGSALGAVRHKGIIPWDDDIDVGMLREDYDKLVDSMKNQPILNHFFQTHESDPEALVNYAKLRKNNTYFEEELTTELNMHKGIFIDIFPFDPAFDVYWKRKLQLWTLTFFHLLTSSATQAICKAAPKRSARILRQFLYKIRPLLPIPLIKSLQDRLIRLPNKVNSSKVGCVDMYGVFKYERTILPIASLVPVKMVPFEGLMQPLPCIVEQHLIQVFGNYMELPPKELRKPAHTKLVKFSQSEA